MSNEPESSKPKYPDPVYPIWIRKPRYLVLMILLMCMMPFLDAILSGFTGNEVFVIWEPSGRIVRIRTTHYTGDMLRRAAQSEILTEEERATLREHLPENDARKLLAYLVAERMRDEGWAEPLVEISAPILAGNFLDGVYREP